MEEAGHISCMVHTIGLPLLIIFLIPWSDNIPWLIQCKWMTSASLNSGRDVMSKPELAISMANKFCREKWRCQNAHHRSQRKCHWENNDWGIPTTVMSSVTLSRTNIFALTPLLLRASIKRLAATAAPPPSRLYLL